MHALLPGYYVSYNYILHANSMSENVFQNSGSIGIATEK